MMWILLVPYTCAAVCDTIISLSLCWYLYNTPTYFAKTHLLINKLILYTVNTSLWTTIFVLLDLMVFIIWPTNLIYVGVFFLLSKLYTNSLLGILNTRRNLRSNLLPSIEVMDLSNGNHNTNNTAPVSSFCIAHTTRTDQTSCGSGVCRCPSICMDGDGVDGVDSVVTEGVDSAVVIRQFRGGHGGGGEGPGCVDCSDPDNMTARSGEAA